MSNVIYLLGAGASYGTREIGSDGKPIFGKIERGLPIVNELEKAIEYYLDKFQSHISFGDGGHRPKYPKMIEELKWLKEKCNSYPTIDTFAKQLSVTVHNKELDRLKNALAAFFGLIQKYETRDLRYDGFIASLIDEHGKLPEDISILSWNYDCQMEFVLDSFSPEHSPITNVWYRWNIGSKWILTPEELNNGVIYKLNGTALLTSVNNHRNLVDPENCNEAFIERVLNSSDGNWQNNISFAWERDSKMEETIPAIVSDASVLVIIGYSFPYVNRLIDKLIVNNMKNLKHVYIQDIYAEDVKQSFESLLDDEQNEKLGKSLKIDCRTSVKQFLIPNELK